MFSKYLSHWYIFLFIIWVLMEKLNIYWYKYINLYYISIILLIGFCVIFGYHILFNNVYYECSFLLTIFLLHAFPLIILTKYYKITKKFAIETLIITTLLYLIFIDYKNLTIYDIYNKKNIILDWGKLKDKCGNKNNIMPLCDIYNFINL